MKIDFERPVTLVELIDYFSYSEDFVGQFSTHRPKNEFYNGEIGFLNLPEVNSDQLREDFLEQLVTGLNEYDKGYEVFDERAWSDVDMAELSVRLEKGTRKVETTGERKAKIFTYDEKMIVPSYNVVGCIQYERIEPTGVQDTLRVLKNQALKWEITPTTKEIEDELLKHMQTGFAPGFLHGYNLGNLDN